MKFKILLTTIVAIAMSFYGTQVLAGRDGNGEKGKGITMDVCHVTGDSRDFAFLISVPLSALKAHLDHGDHEPDSQGSCEDDPTIPPI
jgi:hypothetical protein